MSSNFKDGDRVAYKPDDGGPLGQIGTFKRYQFVKEYTVRGSQRTCLIHWDPIPGWSRTMVPGFCNDANIVKIK